MVTPAESLPSINDIEIMQPSINYHSANMSEMLIVDENSRNCFVKDSPFRLTSSDPRICSYYDLKSTSKGNNDVFDAIVDVVCFYQGVDSNKQDIRIPIRNSGFLVAPPKKLENVWEYYFMTCLHNILPFEYEHKKGIIKKIHRYEPLSARSGNCSVVAKSDLKEEENVKAHSNKDWVLMKMDVRYIG